MLLFYFAVISYHDMSAKLHPYCFRIYNNNDLTDFKKQISTAELPWTTVTKLRVSMIVDDFLDSSGRRPWIFGIGLGGFGIFKAEQIGNHTMRKRELKVGFSRWASS